MKQKSTLLVQAILSISAVVNALIHPIEIHGKHFYDSVTNKPVRSYK